MDKFGKVKLYFYADKVSGELSVITAPPREDDYEDHFWDYLGSAESLYEVPESVANKLKELGESK